MSPPPGGAALCFRESTSAHSHQGTPRCVHLLELPNIPGWVVTVITQAVLLCGCCDLHFSQRPRSAGPQWGPAHSVIFGSGGKMRLRVDPPFLSPAKPPLPTTLHFSRMPFARGGALQSPSALAFIPRFKGLRKGMHFIPSRPFG